MPQLNRSIKSKLNQMYETLDEIQEIWIVNENKELMNELGETMGHIDNALDIINNIDKPRNTSKNEWQYIWPLISKSQ